MKVRGRELDRATIEEIFRAVAVWCEHYCFCVACRYTGMRKPDKVFPTALRPIPLHRWWKGGVMALALLHNSSQYSSLRAAGWYWTGC